MTLRHLRIFTIVCEQQSITRAAQRLYLSQPAVSQAIREIEDTYQIKVFDRIARRIELTDAGRELLAYARPIVDLFEEMETHMRDGGGQPMLRVGASITIGTRFMPAYIRRFTDQYPRVEIHLTVNSTERLEKALLLNELDIAFVEGLAHSPHLVMRPYMDDRLIAVCPRDHPFAGLPGVSLETFLGEPLLLRERGSGTREVFDQAVAARGLAAEPLWESASTEALLAGVAQGLGLSVLPARLVESAVQEHRVACVTIDGCDLTRRFCLVHHRKKYLPQVAEQFISLVLDQPDISL